MKKISIRRSISLPILLLFSLFMFQSCSESEETLDLNNSEAVVIPNTKTTARFILGFYISVETDIYLQDGGCFTIQVRIYSTDANGQKTLLYQAYVKTGDKEKCKDQGVVTFTAPGTGPYLGDIIIQDDLINGRTMRDYFDTYPDVYDDYVIARDRIVK